MPTRQAELLSDSESTLRLLDQLLDDFGEATPAGEPAPAPSAPRRAAPAPSAIPTLRQLHADVRAAHAVVQPGAPASEPRAASVLAEIDARLDALLEVLEAPSDADRRGG